MAGALSNFAEFVTREGEYALARSLLEEALSIFRELGNASGVGWSLNHLGDVAFDEGDFRGGLSSLPRRLRCLPEGWEIDWGIARSLDRPGPPGIGTERSRDARSLAFRAGPQEHSSRLGHTRGVARVLEELACVAVRERDFDRALTLCAAAEGLRQRIGAPKRQAERARLDRTLEPAWRGIDHTSASAIWAEGLRMPLEQAIRYALDRPSSPQALLHRN